MNMPTRERATPRWVLLALVCITALAAGLRLYALDRLPPGLSYDEAWNNLQALRVVQGQTLPVYFVDERRDVEEPLHIYLIAGLFALVGPHAIGGRIVSALLGTLNIPLLFLATREMLRADPHPRLLSSPGRGEHTRPLLAAFVLATLYWHVHYTRLGMEPPAVPTLGTLAFWLLWRAFNRGGWLDFALGGGALGLSLYTHPSARFLPLVAALFMAYRWLTQRERVRYEFPRLILLTMCALLVFAPLGLFFAQHPDLFFYRVGQASVATFSGGITPLAQNALKVIGGLVWRGDTNLRLNLPGRPALDTLQLALCAAGILYSFKDPRRQTGVFVLLWAGVMLLPSVFSDAAPHFGRTLGASPALAALMALGAIQVASLQIGKSATRTMLALAVVAALGYSALQAARDYFITWANDPGLFTAFDAGLRESAEYLAQSSDDRVSFSPVDRDQPIFRFTFRDDVSGQHGLPRLKTFNGRRCAVYPSAVERGWTHIAVLREDAHSLPVMQRAYPSAQRVKEIRAGDAPWAVAYRVPAGSQAQTRLETLAVFGEWLALVQEVTPNSQPSKSLAHAGATWPLTLTWQSLATADVNYTLFVHLATAPNAPPIAQEDAQPCDNSYPTTWWTPGEVIQEERRIAIPANAPPGLYVLAVGVYDLATGQRLPMRAADGTTGDQFTFGLAEIK